MCANFERLSRDAKRASSQSIARSRDSKSLPDMERSSNPSASNALTRPARTRASSVADQVAQHRELMRYFDKRVQEALKERRVFTCLVYYYPIICAELQARGWLEKLTYARHKQGKPVPYDLEVIALSNLLQPHAPNLVLQPKAYGSRFNDTKPIVNHLNIKRELDFTSKYGLIRCKLEEQRRFANTKYRLIMPRAYRLNGTSAQRQAFIDDFNQTQCGVLLDYLWTNKLRWKELVDPRKGEVPRKYLDLALTVLRMQLPELFSQQTNKEHSLLRPPSVEEWAHFELMCQALMSGQKKVRCMAAELVSYANRGHELLEKIKLKRPEKRWDGHRNLWILKPANDYRGQHITIRYSLADILKWAKENERRQYLAQKYIERPLLIYNTKFDMRVYAFMTQNPRSICLYMYKDCYIKLSGCNFNLQDLQECIHLTNFSVQSQYPDIEDERLPSNHMWSLSRFKQYLKEIQAPSDVWPQIYQKMCNMLQTLLMCCYEGINLERECFEIFGVDFMLDETFTPILIEVNHTPDLNPSTAVTKRVCAKLQRDMVKVLIDLKRDVTADIGDFEKIFTIDVTRQPPVVVDTLDGHSFNIPKSRGGPERA